MPSIIVNPSYGNAPYLRAIEVALHVKEKLHADWDIVVPHLYGAHQEKILAEQFGSSPSITLDATFGSILKKVLFDGDSYEAFLRSWLENIDSVSEHTREHLHARYDIAMEIGRAPLIELGIKPSYYTSFSRTSTILEKAMGIDAIAIDSELLKEASMRWAQLEDHYHLHFIAIPGTFEPLGGDIPTPPTAPQPTWAGDVDEGIYVTVSGIPNTESLRSITNHFKIKLYTSDATKIENSTEAPANIIASPRIVAHVARAGWGAIWMSLLTETPLVVPPFDPKDDPEIYFNMERIRELGLGAVYSGQSLEEIMELKPTITAYRKKLLRQFETLDGASYAAEKIAKDFLQKTGKLG